MKKFNACADTKTYGHQTAKSLIVRTYTPTAGGDVKKLLGDIRSLIESARSRTAQAVNAGMVMLYWSIGKRIHVDVLNEKRAGYGDKIVSTLWTQLAYGTLLNS